MCGYECTSVDVFTLSNPTIVSYAMDLFVLILICTPLRQYVVVNDEYSCMHPPTSTRGGHGTYSREYYYTLTSLLFIPCV